MIDQKKIAEILITEIEATRNFYFNGINEQTRNKLRGYRSISASLTIITSIIVPILILILYDLYPNPIVFFLLIFLIAPQAYPIITRRKVKNYDESIQFIHLCDTLISTIDTLAENGYLEGFVLEKIKMDWKDLKESIEGEIKDSISKMIENFVTFKELIERIKKKARKYKVFISSTIEDDKKLLRMNIKSCLEKKYNVVPILSEVPETFPKPASPNLNTFEASIYPIQFCQIFVLIVGKRYGTIEPGKGISIVEAEYNEAVKHDLSRIVTIEREVIQDFNRYIHKVPGWNGKRIKNYRTDFVEILKNSGYDHPEKLMKFISKLSTLKLKHGKKNKDNWYWKFSMKDMSKFLKILEAQIDLYINQLESKEKKKQYNIM